MIHGNIRFICRKCEHTVFVPYTENDSAIILGNRLKNLLNTPCPTCGEEPYMNWFLDRVDTIRKKER